MEGELGAVGLQSLGGLGQEAGDDPVQRPGGVVVLALPQIAQGAVRLGGVAEVVQHDLVKAHLGQLGHQADEVAPHRLIGGGGPVEIPAVPPAVAATGAQGVVHVGAQSLVPEAGQPGHGVHIPLIPGGEGGIHRAGVHALLKGGGQGLLGLPAQRPLVVLHSDHHAVRAGLLGQLGGTAVQQRGQGDGENGGGVCLGLLRRSGLLLGGVGQGRRVTLGHRCAAGVRGLGLRLLGEEGQVDPQTIVCVREEPLSKKQRGHQYDH